MTIEPTDEVAVFGFGEAGSDLLRHRLPQWLGAPPRTIDFRTAGCFFFHANHGEVAESGDALAFKLGFLRSAAGEPLSAQDLLDRRLMTPEAVDGRALRGHALVVCCGKRRAGLTAYSTLLTLSQLFFAARGGELLCATDVRCLLALTGPVELDEEALPMHFLYRSTLGERTYFRGIRRLFPGRVLRWRAGRLTTTLVRDLRREEGEPVFDRLAGAAVDWLEARQSAVMDAYLREIAAAGRRGANLLSGGEDSSVVQQLLQDRLSDRPPSWSFGVRVPDFEFEIAYARRASQAFGNRHVVVDVAPEDYPRWLMRTLAILAQPALINESWPCFLALADVLHARLGRRYDFFFGQSADALHGLPELHDLVLYRRLRAIPGAERALRTWARITGKAAPRYVAGMLAADRQGGSVGAAKYYMGQACDLELPCLCFGEGTVRDVLEQRCALEEAYLGSADLAEQAQTQCLLTTAYDPGAAALRLFAARKLRLIPFFNDEDVIRATMAFTPAVRFLAGGRLKPLQKALLKRRGRAALTGKEKGGTAFNQTFFTWTRSGPLGELAADIERPSFMSRRQLDEVRSRPNHFLWSLLTYDLFRRRILPELK